MTDGGHQNPADLIALREALVALFGDLSEDAVRDVASSGRWIDLEGGRRLIRLGEPANSLYVLVRGRLRASVPGPDGATRVLGEVARGEAVGEMALLGGGRRNANIDAIRDSRLLRFETEAFRELASRHPDFLWNLSRLVIRRLGHAPGSHAGVPQVRHVAIAHAGTAEDRDRFARRLRSALAVHGSTAILDLPSARAATGFEGRPEPLAAWLDEQETRHRFVLTLADPGEPVWTRSLLRQADRILLVARATDDPADPNIARWTSIQEDRDVPVRTVLVLLHADGTAVPRGTSRWLDAHPVDRAYHAREDRDGDFARLARFLAGRAIGLVLAGGGAKGFTQVGILRALREEGLEVDLVGGTSIGSILAATVAFDWDDATRIDNLRSAFVATNPANDYAVPPLVSIVRGRKMERLLHRFIGDTEIEDLWIPYFCVTSNLTASEKAIHTRGPIWRALRASASIAGVFPPVVIDGQLHVDGGTFDNLPVETARALGAGHVIACDIARPTPGRVSYRTTPSTAALLADNVLRRRRYRVPGMISTMMQTTFLAGLDRARTSALDADLFLEPRARGVRFLGWSALDRAAKLGYAYAKETFADPEVRETLEAIRRPTPGPTR